jgi:DNA repair ATPase RecN
MNKHVFEKIAKLEKTELSEVKVDLGAIDDLTAKYQKIASGVVPIKQSVLSEIKKLQTISNDLIPISEDAKKLIEMASFLGADSVAQSAKALMTVSQNLSKSWTKSAASLEQAVKTI